MDNNNYVQCNNNVETCKKYPRTKKNVVVASKKIQFATHNTVVLILYVIQNTNELTKID